jgi:hypothetical protein
MKKLKQKFSLHSKVSHLTLALVIGLSVGVLGTLSLKDSHAAPASKNTVACTVKVTTPYPGGGYWLEVTSTGLTPGNLYSAIGALPYGGQVGDVGYPDSSTGTWVTTSLSTGGQNSGTMRIDVKPSHGNKILASCSITF